MRREHRWLFSGFSLLFIGASLFLVSFGTQMLDVRAERVAYQQNEEGDRVVIIEEVYLDPATFFEQYRINVQINGRHWVNPRKYMGSIEVYNAAGLLVFSVSFDYNHSIGLLIEIPTSGAYTVRLEIPIEYWSDPFSPTIYLFFYRYWRPFLIVGPVLIAIGVVVVIVGIAMKLKRR